MKITDAMVEAVGRVLADEFGMSYDPHPADSSTPYTVDYWTRLARRVLASAQRAAE